LFERKFGTMPPRRYMESPVANPTMEQEMRHLRVRLDAMETMQRTTPEGGDISETEGEDVEI
jgi:hypothetical protein